MKNIDLRDYFAARAMQVAIQKMEILDDTSNESIEEQIEVHCWMAYYIADTMMEVRGIKNERD